MEVAQNALFRTRGSQMTSALEIGARDWWILSRRRGRVVCATSDGSSDPASALCARAPLRPAKMSAADDTPAEGEQKAGWLSRLASGLAKSVGDGLD